LRTAGRLVALGTLGCVMSGFFAPAPAWANFSGCSSAPVGPCEVVNGNHRMVYYVDAEGVNHTYWGAKGHVQVWYQVPNGSPVTIWSSNPSGNPYYDTYFAPGGTDLGTITTVATLYLNKAYPANTRMCTRLGVLPGSCH